MHSIADLPKCYHGVIILLRLHSKLHKRFNFIADFRIINSLVLQCFILCFLEGLYIEVWPYTHGLIAMF